MLSEDQPHLGVVAAQLGLLRTTEALNTGAAAGLTLAVAGMYLHDKNDRSFFLEVIMSNGTAASMLPLTMDVADRAAVRAAGLPLLFVPVAEVRQVCLVGPREELVVDAVPCQGHRTDRVLPAGPGNRPGQARLRPVQDRLRRACA